MERRLLGQNGIFLSVALFASLMVSASATAGPLKYLATILSEDPSSFVDDARAQLALDSGGAFDGVTDVSSVSRLGDGYIEDGDAIKIVHVFDPAASASSVDAVYIYVGFQDDSDSDKKEVVKIKVDGDLIEKGKAEAAIMGGSVATTTLDNGKVKVKVKVKKGDTMLLGSMMAVEYQGSSAAPVPEPGGWMLFAAGAGVVGLAVRNRRSA
ncbi:PEP-CTERM sorting domain-containing protein [Myxococcota bacterium]|nr:PEP-CTERM sorting domain-containing protein [Myxococcota bacterium]